MKALLLLTLLPGLALAQPGPGPGPERPWGPPPGPPPLERLEDLKLTDAQRAKIDDVKGAERRKTIRLDADVRLAEMDLEDAIDRGGDTGAAVARVADLRRQILEAHVATRVAVRALLTPEQRAKLKALRPPPPPR